MVILHLKKIPMCGMFHSSALGKTGIFHCCWTAQMEDSCWWNTTTKEPLFPWSLSNPNKGLYAKMWHPVQALYYCKNYCITIKKMPQTTSKLSLLFLAQFRFTWSIYKHIMFLAAKFLIKFANMWLNISATSIIHESP